MTGSLMTVSVLAARRGVLGAFVAVALALTGCSSGTGAVDVNNGGQFRFVQGTPSGEVIPVGDRGAAPAFSGTLLDGTDFDSASLAGHVAVINFWGSWCGPCRVESPDFQAVYSQVQAQGVQFLGVNVKDDVQYARAFVADKGLTYPSLFDPRGEIALIFRDYPPSSIPSTLLLDADGDVAAVYLGAVTRDTLTRVLATLTAEP